jgi:hypothetical protein
VIGFAVPGNAVVESKVVGVEELLVAVAVFTSDEVSAAVLLELLGISVVSVGVEEEVGPGVAVEDVERVDVAAGDGVLDKLVARISVDEGANVVVIGEVSAELVGATVVGGEDAEAVVSGGLVEAAEVSTVVSSGVV